MTTALALTGAVGTALWLVAIMVILVRYRSSTGVALGRLQWLAWGVVVTATVGLVGAVLSLLVDWPSSLWAGMSIGVVVLPLSLAIGRSRSLLARAEEARS